MDSAAHGVAMADTDMAVSQELTEDMVLLTDSVDTEESEASADSDPTGNNTVKKFISI